jgi:hypothetical protein
MAILGLTLLRSSGTRPLTRHHPTMSTRCTLRLIRSKWDRTLPPGSQNKCIQTLSKSNMTLGLSRPLRMRLQANLTVRATCRRPTITSSVTIPELELMHTNHTQRIILRQVSESSASSTCFAHFSGRTVTSTVYQNTSYEPYNPPPPPPYQPYSTSQYPAQQPSYDPYKPTATTSMSDSYAPRQPARQLSTPAQPQAAQPDSHRPVSRSVSSPYSASFAVASQQQQPPNGVPAQASKPPAAPTAAEFRPKASNAYDPPLPPPKVHRTMSPSSLRFTGNSQGPVSHISHPPPINTYDHRSMPGPPRTMSPSSIRSVSPASGSFAPSKTIPAYTSSQLRGRSTSNSSTLSSQSVPDPPQPRKEYGLGFGAHIAEPSSYGSQSHHPVEQDIHVSRAIRLPYAPSPSLLGSNDPLGRTSSRAPVISFGFGGKVLTCFHGSADLNTGFDVALSSRRTTNVTIRVLHQLLPDYVSETKAAEYPGPLFSDPGTPVTSLVRTGTSQAKTKKAHVIKYLEERAEEILRGTMYISDNIERQRLEGKLVLAQLLKIMVENDGSLLGR